MKKFVSLIILMAMTISIFAIDVAASTYKPETAPLTYEMYVNKPATWTKTQKAAFDQRYFSLRKQAVKDAYASMTVQELGITPATFAQKYIPAETRFAIGEEIGLYNKDIIQMLIPIMKEGYDRASLNLQFQLSRQDNSLKFHRAFIQLERKGYALQFAEQYEWGNVTANYFINELRKGYNGKDSMYAPRPYEALMVTGVPLLQPTGKKYVTVAEYLDPALASSMNEMIIEMKAAAEKKARTEAEWEAYCKANYMTPAEGKAYLESKGLYAWDLFKVQESVVKGMTWEKLTAHTAGMEGPYEAEGTDVPWETYYRINHKMDVAIFEAGTKDKVYCEFTLDKKGNLVLVNMYGNLGLTIERKRGATNDDFRVIFEESNSLSDEWKAQSDKIWAEIYSSYE